jgi:hypothetical protein
MSAEDRPSTDSRDRIAPAAGAALALKFALELCALAALAYWGANTGTLLLNIALGCGAPLTAAIVWGTWAAPNSPRRLHGAARLGVESGVFAAAALALILSGAPVLAGVLVVLVALDTWLLHRSRG